MNDSGKIDLLGVQISLITVESLINHLSRAISEGRKTRAVYVNVHAINLSHAFRWFCDFINDSDIAYCDGYGVKWGARFLGMRIPERLSPPDWIIRLIDECSHKRFSIYLIGGKLGVTEEMKRRLKEKYPDLQIVGVQHGFFDKTPNSSENLSVIRAINLARADILLVGLGMPLQERWLMENWERLDVRVALPVGAMFDYFTGAMPRSPRWITDHGMEWLSRLIMEPHRLWQRYIIGNPYFVWRLFQKKLSKLLFRQKGIMN